MRLRTLLLLSTIGVAGSGCSLLSSGQSSGDASSSIVRRGQGILSRGQSSAPAASQSTPVIGTVGVHHWLGLQNTVKLTDGAETLSDVLERAEGVELGIAKQAYERRFEADYPSQKDLVCLQRGTDFWYIPMVMADLPKIRSLRLKPGDNLIIIPADNSLWFDQENAPTVTFHHVRTAESRQLIIESESFENLFFDSMIENEIVKQFKSEGIFVTRRTGRGVHHLLLLGLDAEPQWDSIRFILQEVVGGQDMKTGDTVHFASLDLVKLL